MKKIKTKDEIRLLAMGYLWNKTQGKSSQEAMRSFSEGAAWAYELLHGCGLDNKEMDGKYEVSNNE